MSVLTYNGITLSMVKTNILDRVARFSEDGTEYMWTECILDVSSVYSPGTTSYPQPGQSSWITDQYIKFRLMQPRQNLTFTNESGIPLIYVVSEGSSTVDCDNGPTPLSCSITTIVSQKTFYIRYVIKASIIDCPVGTEPSPIASSRYSRTEMINGQDLSVMVTNGNAVFRSNVLANLATNADSYRGYIIPPCPLGYKRDNLVISLDPNGTYMQFTCTDIEQMVDIGSGDVPGTAGSVGIKEMGLVYTGSTISEGALGFASFMSQAGVEAYAIGNKSVSTLVMLQFLYATAINKLGAAAKGGFLVVSDFKEDVFKKIVSIKMVYNIINPNDAGLPDFNLAVKGYVGEPIVTLPDTGGVNPTPPFSQGTRGTAGYVLAVSAFATACYTDPSTVAQDYTGILAPNDLYQKQNQQGFPNVVAYEDMSTPDGNSLVRKSKQSQESPGDPDKTGYINYSVKTSYVTSKGIIIAPVATPVSSSDPEGGYVPGGSGNNDTASSSNSSNVSAINIQVFQPNTNKICSFIIERVGCIPEIPNPKVQDGSSGYTLLDSTITPVGIELAPDGYTRVYRVSGAFTYSVANAQDDNGTIPFDIPPWVNIESDQYSQIQESQYVDGIINNQVADNGSGGNGGSGGDGTWENPYYG